MAKQATEPTAPVYLVYKGVTGPAQDFPHEGELTIARPGGGDPLCIAPGLNIVDGAAYAACAKSKGLERRIADGHIVVTDEVIKGYTTPAAWKALIEQTMSPDALEHLQTIELAKPQSGAPRDRRSPEIVAILEKRLAAATRRPTLDLTGIHQRAAEIAAAAQPARAAAG